MMQPFGPWLPDVASFQSGASTVALNVIPAQGSYRPFEGFQAIAAGLPLRVQGAVSARATQTQQIFNFCGTASKLYKLDAAGMSWLDVSRTVGGAYNTPPDGFWSFSQFGDYVIATNNVDADQYFALNSSTNFALLAGSPPLAQYSAVVRDFVVLGGLATNLNRVQWSGINAPDSYVPSTVTMSDYQDFPEGGRVTGIMGGDVGIVFCERAIYRMAFEGPPVIFRFDKIATSLGCRAPRSIAGYEGLVFFLAYDGVYMIRGASEMIPVGAEKVDRWLADKIDVSKIDRVTGAIDPDNKIYLMGFVSRGSSEPDTILLYHWTTGQFAYVEREHTLLYSAARQEGVTIDGLDAIAATIDALPYTIDSLFYSGVGQLSFAGFDGNYRMGFFDGENMEATIETGDFQLSEGRKSMVRAVRPIVEGAFTAPSIVIRSRDVMHETLRDAPASQATHTGVCNVRVNARYHRAKMTIPPNADWKHADGIDDVKFSTMGQR
jgi:hypothetical protein